ncbi:MAG TPA: ribonuclease HII [Ruminococcaceae bacterium]|nr:ribonuclease HII [Oscillospiraceae bacterium]
MPDYTYENAAMAKGFEHICGVDEAGRGPLAGPVFAAAVILKPGTLIEGLDDSKKLSEKKREKLFHEITEKAVSWSAASVDEKIIDEINILNAAMRAMREAVEALGVTPDYVLIDGNKCPEGINAGCEAVIGGDSKSMSVAAASIIAKVLRDRYMREIAGKYEIYCFEKHKGYGTKLHMDLIREHGPCEIHRVSFLKKII